MHCHLYLPSNFMEYGFLFTFIWVCTATTLLMLVLTNSMSESKNDHEKLSAYECGFDPFGDARHTFSPKFYLVAMLFLMFDLEMIFLFPWAVTVNTYQSFYVMLLFVLMLTAGFIYEWGKGALDW